MKDFTIIGYWTDSLQRFSTYVEAAGADEAEETCLRENPEVAVCAVLPGRQKCVETAEYVRVAAE